MSISREVSINESEKKRASILRVSHLIALSISALCIIAIIIPFVHPNKFAGVLSDLGMAVLSALLVYKLIEIWVNKEYREVRIQEYRSTLLHKDSISTILKDGAVEDILECCLGLILRNKEFASGARQLLSRYSRDINGHIHHLRETITVADYNEKYHQLKRNVSFNKLNFPSTISFRCKLVKTTEEHRGVIYDRTREESWVFLNHPEDTVLPEEAFQIIEFKIGTQILSPVDRNSRISDTEIEYLFRIPDEYAGKNDDVKIRYTMKVLQSKTGSFYSFVTGPTKNMTVIFKNEANEHSHVVAEGIGCIDEPQIIDDDNSHEISVDGWVFPNSVIVFTWSSHQPASKVLMAD